MGRYWLKGIKLKLLRRSQSGTLGYCMTVLGNTVLNTMTMLWEQISSAFITHENMVITRSVNQLDRSNAFTMNKYIKPSCCLPYIYIYIYILFEDT